jgi:transcriptional regulator with XRE-family HTH domain
MAPTRNPQPALGKALRQIREREGLSQEEVGLNAGLDPTWVSKIERGHNNPAWSTVRRLADALGITMLELVALAERIELE